MAEIEKKYFNFDVKNTKEQGTFEAYLAVFGNIDHDNDIIEKSAFTDDKKSQGNTKSYPLLYNHDLMTPIGGFVIKTIDSHGVLIDGFFDVQNNEQAKQVHSLIMKGVDIKLSVGFIAQKSEHAVRENKTVRIITKGKIMEGSIVPFPSNERAEFIDVKNQDLENIQEESVNIKSLSEAETLRDIEDILKERADFSKSERKTLISKIKEYSQRDADIEVKSELPDVVCDFAQLVQQEYENIILAKLKNSLINQ